MQEKNTFCTNKLLFILELAAVVFGLLYLVFIVLKKPIAWIFGILSALIYVFLFFKTRLYYQSCLQLFYVALGFYGWWYWKKQVKITPQSWGILKHGLSILIGLTLSLILGLKFMKNGQSLPFLDATIAVFCVLATYLTSRAILENWYYWIVLNFLSIFLFHYNSLYLTELLSFANLLLSIYGLVQWKRKPI